MSRGNGNIILCERGIRTYETATRNTLDISAVPILKQETHLPVMVDVTHSTGRRDLLIPTAKAAIAIGADAIMAEVHPDPAVALSDAQKQMDIDMFDKFYNEVTNYRATVKYILPSKIQWAYIVYCIFFVFLFKLGYDKVDLVFLEYFTHVEFFT